MSPLQNRLQPTMRKNIPLVFLFALFFSSSLFGATGAVAQGPGQQDYRLVGTIESNGFAGAVLSDAKGEQSFYRLHDMLPNGFQLVQVRPDSVLVRGTDGKDYEMFILHETSTVGAATSKVQPEPQVPAATNNAPAAQQIPRQYRRHTRPTNAE
jgi:hypothetical protein